MWRRRAHWVARKKGWVFTSDAPARDPIRRSSSLMRSLRISDLQRLEEAKSLAYVDVGLQEGLTLISVEHQNVQGMERRRGGYSQTWHSGSCP